MKRLIITSIVLLLVAVACLKFLFGRMGDKLAEANQPYIERVGEKFVLENDTLTITDYSVFEENFTLSNGKKVNSELVFKTEK